MMTLRQKSDPSEIIGVDGQEATYDNLGNHDTRNYLVNYNDRGNTTEVDAGSTTRIEKAILQECSTAMEHTTQ
jgi:hypothetical protein